MTVQVTIGDEQENKLGPEDTNLKFDLQVRRTVDGNIMFLDHPDAIIAVLPGASKVLVYPRNELGDQVYDVADRLMRYLINKGIVLPETVHASNLYGSLEAKFPESAVGGKSYDIALLGISKFLEEEKQWIEYGKQTEKQEEERLLEPDGDDSTELGEVPQAQFKGTIPISRMYTWLAGE